MNPNVEKNFSMDETREEAFWKDCVFIFDSSALLAFYDYSQKGRDEIFNEIIDKLPGRLWVPSHVQYEYFKNRKGKLQNPINEKINPIQQTHLKAIDDYIKKVQDEYIHVLNKTKPNDFPPSIDDPMVRGFEKQIDEFKEAFSEIKAKINGYLQKEISQIIGIESNDTILEKFNQAFRIGDNYPFDSTINTIKEEGEFRFRNLIPPGYMDDPKNNSRSKKKGIQIYGDLIIWKQILDYIKAHPKNTIFVTNDLKEDWCYTIKGEAKRVDRPREELVQEFYDSTGKEFWLYSLSDLAYFAKKYLKSNITNEVADEVEENIEDKSKSFKEKERIVYDWFVSRSTLRIDHVFSEDVGYDFVGRNNMSKKVLIELKFSAESFLNRNDYDRYPEMAIRAQRNLYEDPEYTDYIICVAFSSRSQAMKAKLMLQELVSNQVQRAPSVMTFYFVVGYFDGEVFNFIYSDYSQLLKEN